MQRRRPDLALQSQKIKAARSISSGAMEKRICSCGSLTWPHGLSCCHDGGADCGWIGQQPPHRLSRIMSSVMPKASTKPLSQASDWTSRDCAPCVQDALSVCTAKQRLSAQPNTLAVLLGISWKTSSAFAGVAPKRKSLQFASQPKRWLG